MTSLSIYIHIPFCIQKCLYCDFLSFPKGREQQALYFDALKKEIELGAVECEEYEVVSIFFGGGTPTSAEPHFIAVIMSILKAHYNLREDAEITIECNPGTADYEALKLYREAGVNRISIGLQSANDEELKRLGRIHNLRQFEECYKNARAAGFENINVDLMSALPGQSLEDWENNLNYVCDLQPKPEHISAYSLIIEEGTPFFEMYGEDAENALPLPDEDTERDMYHRTKQILKQNGYHRYEISNYALDSCADNVDADELIKNDTEYECLHNKRYWQGGDYIGFGLGAASLMQCRRFHNTAEFQKYVDALIKPDGFNNELSLLHSESHEFPDYCSGSQGNPLPEAIREDVETLDETSKMEEFMFLGLRMIKGVSIEEFKKRFGKSIDEIYGDVINKLVSDGLMEREKEQLRLTERGLDLSNYCMALFLIDE